MLRSTWLGIRLTEAYVTSDFPLLRAILFVFAVALFHLAHLVPTTPASSPFLRCILFSCLTFLKEGGTFSFAGRGYLTGWECIRACVCASVSVCNQQKQGAGLPCGRLLWDAFARKKKLKTSRLRSPRAFAVPLFFLQESMQHIFPMCCRLSSLCSHL